MAPQLIHKAYMLNQKLFFLDIYLFADDFSIFNVYFLHGYFRLCYCTKHCHKVFCTQLRYDYTGNVSSTSENSLIDAKRIVRADLVGTVVTL